MPTVSDRRDGDADALMKSSTYCYLSVLIVMIMLTGLIIGIGVFKYLESQLTTATGQALALTAANFGNATEAPLMGF